MASSQRGQRLTEAHRLAQIENQRRFLAGYLAVWPTLDPRRLEETAPGWLRLVLQMLAEHRQESAELAATYFRELRLVEAEDPLEPAPQVEFRQPPAPATSAAAVRQSGRQPQTPNPARVSRPRKQSRLVVNWGDDDKAARSSLIVTGPVNIKARTARGQGLQIVNRAALVESSGAASRHVLNGGRRVLLASVEGDGQAIGWQRVGDGDPCSFCAVLISRGPVYTSRAQAAFQAHDHCACSAEPVFSRDSEWAPNARELRRMWYRVTKGYSGKDALNAFRRAYEAERRQAGVEAA